MIRFAKDAAALRLPKSLYARESLRAGALAVDGWDVYLESDGRFWRIALRRGAAAGTSRDGAGAFLNEALSHGYRQRVIAFNRSLTQPVLGRLFDQSFPAPRPDPLEELEPQVARDRQAETKTLLDRAALLGPPR